MKGTRDISLINYSIKHEMVRNVIITAIKYKLIQSRKVYNCVYKYSEQF